MHQDNSNPQKQLEIRQLSNKGRNLRTRNNLFNPVSEFGLGVQVIKLNKQLKLLQKTKNKKLSIKQQIYLQHQDILQKRSILQATSKNSKYLDSFLRLQQQEKKKLLRPHLGYKLVTGENQKNKQNQQQLNNHPVLISKKNKSSLMRNQSLQQQEDQLKGQLFSHKIILPKIDRSLQNIEKDNIEKQFNQADAQAQNRKMDKRSSYGKTVYNFKIRKQYIGTTKTEKFKKRRQMILRQKQLKNEKLYGKFGEKIFSFKTPQPQQLMEHAYIKTQNISPKVRAQSNYGPGDNAGEMIKKIQKLKREYEFNIQPIIPVVQKIYIKSQKIPSKQAQIIKRQKESREQIQNQNRLKEYKELRPIKLKKLSEKNFQEINQQNLEIMKKQKPPLPQNAQLVKQQEKSPISPIKIKQNQKIKETKKHEIKQNPEVLKKPEIIEKLENQEDLMIKENLQDKKKVEKFRIKKDALHINIEEKKIDDEYEGKPQLGSVIGLGGMKSARAFNNKKSKKIKSDKERPAKDKKDKKEKQDDNLIDLQAYQQDLELDMFNDDFELGDYMDYQNGIINIEEEKEELLDLDSSAEFHEWEKRQRAITPDARISKQFEF